ncbi:MAG: hypothetical protein JEZ09_08190 [Salinivirgaceae bacterium]|nr:hypothetical protein [Salinivirgaceae bacterium]
MNKTQQNHYRMFLATQDYLDAQTPVWSTIPRVVTYKNDFDELLTRISELSETASSSVSVTERKKQLRSALSIKISKLSGAMQAYCYDSDNLDLLKKITFSQTDVMRFKEQELDEKIANFLNIMTEHLSNLADFGITNDMVVEASTTHNEFSVLIGKPRVMINNKYIAISNLSQLFDAANALLKQKLDKLMLMFKDSNSGFYEGYERSRVIVDM